MEWPREITEECTRVMGTVAVPRTALLTLLDLGQRRWGWVPPAWIEYVASVTDVHPARVRSLTASLPGLRDEPVGRHTVALCAGLACRLMGARSVADRVMELLGITWDETTPDGRITLLRKDCQGACSTAPVMQVDERLYTALTLERVEQILAALR